ncbi:hypothetical protein EV182_000706 [Spiromyces aspiralis]|uniref:Uncharacterized protein n=1 Tax=Spiromyces aspiralis TaxID=68401 RepID=A0ACC1HU45_9FUNG|nr:hypothetical protein EV182_000706 [Spiromyces aspiralis]
MLDGTMNEKSTQEVGYTIDQLLNKSQELIDGGEYELALQFCVRAHEMDDQNTRALLQAATVQLEIGDIEPAYNKCVELEPDTGYIKYLYLGQLSGELEAVKYFEKGLEIMYKELEAAKPGSDEARDLRRKISEAHISITEIYLTDCCYEPDAEKQCETNLDKAIAVDPECPDAHQTYASVKLSQQRIEEAKQCLEKSISLWKDLEPGHPNIPSYDSRLTLVRLHLECQLYEKALDLLETLQKENDESVDLWYLYGWTYFLRGDSKDVSTEEKSDAWNEARDCLERALALAATREYDDSALTEHARELVEKINTQVPRREGDDEEEVVPTGDEKGEWEDIDTEDEMEVVS